MPLTLADIDRWDSGCLRQVSTALGKRGASAADVREGLRRLPLIASWQGSGGDAARESLDTLSTHLVAHADEMQSVSLAFGKAADDVQTVKDTLSGIDRDAYAWGFTIDRATGTVTAIDGLDMDYPPNQQHQAELDGRITRVLADADIADDDLARAITTAGHDATGPAETRPDVRAALSGPLPEDPKQFHDLWDTLTPQEKDWLYSHDHNIGNHPGMPRDPADHLGYKHYNQRHLADELAQARAAAARADALKNQHPDWAAGRNIPHPNEPGAIFADRQAYEAWQRHYDAARDGAKYLPDLQAVDKAVKLSPDRTLMLLDTKSGKQVHAVIAVGDPDTATHVSVTAPGLNTTVHDSIGSMADEATKLRTEALRQLHLTPGHGDDTVSAIAWIGYDTPHVPGWDHLGSSLSGGWDVTHDNLARAGAHDLARFYDGLGASHQGGPFQLTAIGHSYGSLTTGLALQEPGNHGVTNAVFYGSPGIEASTPAQLHLQPGHVYAMEAPDDPIQRAYDTRSIGLGIPILGTYLNNEFGDFGPNPATNPDFTHLATGPTTVPDGRTLEGVSGSHAHSRYPQQGDNGQPRTSGYNIAAVIAGLTPIRRN
ncbi:alpha/beta hydrolase [Mycobacterium sp.]|uniref:alpha/beta hydrolase n=1 Tax=Mycobacterium sp. TaxID=1785 RepID=UPI0031D1BEC2